MFPQEILILDLLLDAIWWNLRNVFHPGKPRTQSTAFSKGFYNGIQWGSGIHVIVLCFER